MSPTRPKAKVTLPLYVLITLNICNGGNKVTEYPQTTHLFSGVNICVDSTSDKEPVKAYTKMSENSKKKERDIMAILNYTLVFQDTHS